MNRELLLQLKSPDPERRRQAIIALGRAKDPQALAALAEVYRRDPVPELRQLAFKAGRYIQQQTQTMPVVGSVPPAQTASPQRTGPIGTEAFIRPAGTGALIQPEPEEELAVPARDAERAKTYYNRALDQHMAGDNEKALKELRRALEINPALRSDPVIQNLAQAITGIVGEQAVRLMADPEQDLESIATGGIAPATPLKKRQRGISEAEITWNDIAIDVALLFMVAVIGQAIPIVLVWLSRPADFREAFPLAMLANALGTGTVTVLGVLLSDGAIHIAAGFLGGRGALTDLYHALIPVDTVFYILVYAAIAVALVIVGAGAGLDTEAGLSESGLENLGAILLVLGLLVLGRVYVIARRVSEVHEFGLGAGCGAMIVGAIVVGVVQFVASLVNLGISVLPTAFSG